MTESSIESEFSEALARLVGLTVCEFIGGPSAGTIVAVHINTRETFERKLLSSEEIRNSYHGIEHEYVLFLYNCHWSIWQNDIRHIDCMTSRLADLYQTGKSLIGKFVVHVSYESGQRIIFDLSDGYRLLADLIDEDNLTLFVDDHYFTICEDKSVTRHQRAA